jgi:hypothetical protein
MIKIISGHSAEGGSTEILINLTNLFNENGYDCIFYGLHDFHLGRCKSEKLEKELTELRGKPAETNLTMEAIKVGKKLDKFSEEEIDSIVKIIKSDKPSDILSALENPLIMQGIQTAREKVTKESKVPSSSGSSGGDSFPDSQTIEKMERDDHKKLWKEQQERQQGGQGI